ncbi:MAPEG family protein [Marinomonas sp. C2222]|uniref:MAPEG family protein n=1 Tax=Marinomonas sargassi TaxID=2984494 RepID=A0ABT2YRM4_9GAMM|nr:MAPEG family protein [Marinomonas sargassi]MCV2402540.1 MAPEG family protein [Marinomonas sargassi]
MAGYILWMLLLLIILEIFRSYLVVSSGRAANSFHPSGSDTTAFGQRLTRAHANCYEFFPVFAGVIILAVVSDKTAVTDSLALFCLGARLAQSCTHLMSASNLASQVRFLFFIAQIGICLFWLIEIIKLDA